MRSYAAPSTLGRVDRRSLKLTGRSLGVSADVTPGALSPDGKQLLLLSMRPSEPALSVVDLTAMRVDTTLQGRLDADLGSSRAMSAVWPSENRILVVADTFGRRRWRRGPRIVTGQTLLAINPTTGALEWKRNLNATLHPSYPGAGTVGQTAIFVLQSATRQQQTQAKIISVSPDGTIGSSTVALVKGGYNTYPAQLVVTSGVTGSHVYVLTGGGIAYSIDPTTMHAVRHRIATPSHTPDTSPPDLLSSAAPLGPNIVASGFLPRPNGLPAAGIYIIDPSTWTVRLVDPTTPAWLVTDNSLITFTISGQFRLPSSWKTKGTGIRIYDERGNLRSHLYGTQAFTSVTATPAFALAILPTVPNRIAPPHGPAQYRAREASTRLQELLFNPATGQSVGKRTQVGLLPGLIQAPKSTPHR
jgi:hypothetical protein